ncbi:uncharacterized protein LOC107780720 [Nicotiana tabacum]|uniref:Uncharacterized protein LOC107780720 n=1 Tax=Nicotiana tabacum TaxID=4097 RepID=A0A1S3YXG9_TOBAC|nr:uncharacterized protein LOC104086329 [Nicotiana tomentosiformis]XP_016456780.1 PREDICTED: uncharacterized protein LOC107780720 [Nicotiana tabacum]
MGTEVLRPQNCLREPQPATVFHRRKTGNGYYNNYGYRKPVVRTEKKKLNNKSQNQNQNHSEPLISRRSSAEGGKVTGYVTILRRGESLDSLNPKIGSGKKKSELTVYGTGRLGPEQPGMVPKQIRVGFSPADMYAGSAAFSNSPSPRSLPLPSFFNNSKKQVEFKSFDDFATRDLRRLLRLE